MSDSEGVPGEAGQGAENVSPPVSPPAAPPPPPAPTEPFFKSIKNAELRGYAEVKGFKGADGVEFAETVLNSYRNLEKLRGVPEERLLTLPENLEDAEAMKPIYAKLGLAAPEKAEDYGFATVEGVDTGRAKTLSEIALKHGVPPKMAAAVFKDVMAADMEAQAQFDTTYNEEVAIERGRLQAELGSKYDAFVEEGRRAARRYGLDEEAIANLEAAIGFEKTMRFMNAVGRSTGEGEFVDGQKPNQFSMTPEGAQTKRAQLMADKDFTAKYLAGDKNAKEQISRLNQIIANATPGATP